MTELREQTLFSTSFFDFQAGYEHPVLMSKWIWLYFVITVLLSGLLIGWWRYLSVQKQHILDKEFENYDGESPNVSAKNNSANVANEK